MHPVNNPGLTIEISSKYTFASCGSLHNPALLLRSKITCQGNVGKHLHLHCGAVSIAGFPKKVQFTSRSCPPAYVFKQARHDHKFEPRHAESVSEPFKAKRM